jgi:hypothetical protein
MPGVAANAAQTLGSGALPGCIAIAGENRAKNPKKFPDFPEVAPCRLRIPVPSRYLTLMAAWVYLLDRVLDDN